MKTFTKTRGISTVIAIAVLFVMFVTISFARQIDLNSKTALKSYIEKAGKDPDQYVIDKFKTKKVVVLSEFYRLKHEINFVKNLIPKLASNGIYYLAVEYGNTADQKALDNLLNASNFDKDQAIRIMKNFKQYGAWGYKEYLDIYKTAWEVNNGKTPFSEKFRIVLLNDPKYQSRCGKTDYAGRNKNMAEIIDKEIISKGGKALVFVSSQNTENCAASMKSTAGENKSIKLSAILESKYKGNISTVMFHAPWLTLNKDTKAANGLMKPMDGEIDAALETLGNNPVGFDIDGSPLQNLAEKKSAYYTVNNDYTFRCLCDGYIYLKPYEEYEFAEWIPEFIDEENFEFVKNYFNRMNPDLKIETMDYASDLCNAKDWTLLESARQLQNKDLVKFEAPQNQAMR